MKQPVIERVEWARLPGRRPRLAGCNARLGTHGQDVSCALVRVTDSDGVQGWGWSAVTREAAQALLGAALPADVSAGIAEPLGPIEYPLLDLAGKRAGQPVYALVARNAHATPLTVPCYDTSLYMDDLGLADDAAAADLMAAEAVQGADRGHTAFKLKVGRGAMHMPLRQGTTRDIAVVRAVRAAIGPDAKLMIDANNGYNANLARYVLAETAPERVYWLEEPFAEDARYYAYLCEWMRREGLATFLADGEGRAAPDLVDLARDGLVAVVQYDIRRPGFTHWLTWGPRLAAVGTRAAPHNYGDPFGNYATCHLAAALPNLEMVEWDEADVMGIDAGGYVLRSGHVSVPATPGFGLELDEAIWRRNVSEHGWQVSA